MFKRQSFFWWAVAALVAVRLVVMATSSVFDPSEARYATLAANMARTGDYVVPHFIHGGVYQSFDGKPPLLFQAGGVACKLFGESEFATRLPSFLAAGLLLFILNFAAGRRAVLICATSVAFYALAGFCMTDMLLTLSVAGALLLEDVFNRKPTRQISLCIFALLGLGMLTKGPIALVLFGLPTFLDACINKRWGILARHSWVLGPLLFLAISAPWYILMEQRTPGFLSYFFIHENFLRFVTHNYGDKYGSGREFCRGMALVWLLVVTLPWTLFIRPKRKLPRFDLLALGLISITAFWCLTSRIPLAYMLPTVPLFAALLAPHLTARQFSRGAIFACILAPFVLIATLLITAQTTNKMSGRFFQKVARSLDKNEKVVYAERKYYAPEFYLGSHLVPSQTMPTNGLVLVRRKTFRKSFPPSTPIRFEDKNWVVVDLGEEGKR